MTSVPEKFRAVAVQTPAATAVVGPSATLSYAELDQWSGELAGRLLAEGGVRHGDRIVVCVERSVELIVALLGVLKAGAAYVPIDPEEPDKRVADILADAEVSVAVCDADSAARFKAYVGTVIDVSQRGPALPEGLALPATAPDDLAYMMFTSGSTGRPKAVMVEHGNITNLVTEPNYVELRPEDRVLQLAPVAFDAATFEIWGPLLNGGTVAVAPPGQLQPDELEELISGYGITVLWLTTALFNRQVDIEPEALAGLRAVLTGGDVSSVPHVRALMEQYPDLQIVNCYGPTETTTFALSYPIPRGRELETPIPIGRELQNVIVRIAGDGVLLPDGQAGELWIGGAGVARGYWRRPELTAEKFVRLADGTRFYRSGDLARRRPDGVIEFMGRIDDQFKLRGYRIEPGEIESVLTEHEQVRAAAVALRETDQGDRRLVAWVVAKVDTTDATDLDRKSLKAFVRDRLPDYMIPAVFLQVNDLPITQNGKVDRKALPEPDWSNRAIYV